MGAETVIKAAIQREIPHEGNDLMRRSSRFLRSTQRFGDLPLPAKGPAVRKKERSRSPFPDFLLQIRLNCRTFPAMSRAVATDLEADSLVSLSQARVGCDFRIRFLDGPACEQLRQLGFCESLQVRKLADGRNLICSVCGTRLALSRELASQVMGDVA
jgi:ferrous iron transport protein A